MSVCVFLAVVGGGVVEILLNPNIQPRNILKIWLKFPTKDNGMWPWWSKDTRWKWTFFFFVSVLYQKGWWFNYQPHLVSISQLWRTNHGRDLCPWEVFIAALGSSSEASQCSGSWQAYAHRSSWSLKANLQGHSWKAYVCQGLTHVYKQLVCKGVSRGGHCWPMTSASFSDPLHQPAGGPWKRIASYRVPNWALHIQGLGKLK